MSTQDRRSAVVVTVSDGVAQGVREDASGRATAALLESSGFVVTGREVVPDEPEQIGSLLLRLRDQGVPLVVTTGGTGLGPRDVTPEATRATIDREAPGLAEEMRAAGRGSTPFAALSRGVAGVAGNTLILNLPGSEKGAVESLTAILPVLSHALDLLAGDAVHGPGRHDTTGPGHQHRGPAGGAGSIEEELASRRAAGEDVVLATAVRVQGDPPCRVGQKMLLGPRGPLAGTLGCAEFDDAATADAPGVLRDRDPSTRTYTQELGSVDVFLEPMIRRPLLVAFSATPVARALLRWAGELGFEPILVESRSDRVTPEHEAAGRVVGSLDQVPVEADTVAIHTDHDAPGVAQSVASLLRSKARFIGVMGSLRHVGPHVASLREMGFGDEELSRIRTPVGIDLGADTAEEIALSILAGAVADRHDASGGWLDRR
jgi:molybdopterin adenylyltransferase